MLLSDVENVSVMFLILLTRIHFFSFVQIHKKWVLMKYNIFAGLDQPTTNILGSFMSLLI